MKTDPTAAPISRDEELAPATPNTTGVDVTLQSLDVPVSVVSVESTDIISAEPETDSHARPVLAEQRASTGDTLISAPAPADPDDLANERRVHELEQKLYELTERLTELERRSTGAPLSRDWLMWVVFLLVLAVLGLMFKK